MDVPSGNFTVGPWRKTDSCRGCGQPHHGPHSCKDQHSAWSESTLSDFSPSTLYLLSKNISSRQTYFVSSPAKLGGGDIMFLKCACDLPNRPNHCLHPLLPPDRTLNHEDIQLPTCSFNLHKKSFVISCLFKFLTRVCSCFVCVVFFSFLDCFFFSNVLLISVYHV